MKSVLVKFNTLKFFSFDLCMDILPLKKIRPNFKTLTFLHNCPWINFDNDVTINQSNALTLKSIKNSGMK